MTTHLSTESFGDRIGRVKLTISIEADRELSNAEQEYFGHECSKIHKVLETNIYNAHPKTRLEGDEERRQLLNCFETAIYVKEIPNEYNRNRNPWFLVTTHKGVIKIGRRKRVVNIDWSESDQMKDAHELFPNEDVTKMDRSIHAWGYDTAKEYINTILNTK